MSYFFQANLQKISIFFNGLEGGTTPKISILLFLNKVNIYLGKVKNFWGILITKFLRNSRNPPPWEIGLTVSVDLNSSQLEV